MQKLFQYKQRWNYYYSLTSLFAFFVSFVRSVLFCLCIVFVREVNSLCVRLLSCSWRLVCTQTLKHLYVFNATIHTRCIVVSRCVFHAPFIHRNTCSLIRLFFVVSFILSFVFGCDHKSLNSHSHTFICPNQSLCVSFSHSLCASVWVRVFDFFLYFSLFHTALMRCVVFLWRSLSHERLYMCMCVYYMRQAPTID